MKFGVALLVVGVVVDVLGHVLVDDGERPGVGPVPASARDLAVLDAAELVVLLPQVGFEQLGGGEELENRSVSRGEAVTGKRGRRVDQESPCAEGQGPGCGSPCRGRRGGWCDARTTRPSLALLRVGIR